MKPLITSDQFTGEEIKGLCRTFPLYVYMPDEYLPRIRLAEEFTDEGNKEYEELSQICGELLDPLPTPLEDYANRISRFKQKPGILTTPEVEGSSENLYYEVF